jgi:peptide/nickel transport system substrate-binding protein
MDKKSILSELKLRDFFWNYPKYLVNMIRATNPLSLIILALILGYLSFVLLISEPAKILVEGRDTHRITEGTVGALVSTNPMYITRSHVDRDLYALIYKRFVDLGEDGEPIASIAKEWEQESELEYLFKIQEDFFWHDGRPLTADDIVWNFEVAIALAQEYDEDTYGTALEAVEIEKVSDYEVRFILEEKNATFWEAISVYIIPMHPYENVSLRNFGQTKEVANPIGCGVYRVGAITDGGISLVSEEANIREYKYLFFNNYDSLNLAIKNDKLDIVSHVDIEKIENLDEYPFLSSQEIVLNNRHKLIYFNTRREKFEDNPIRQALSYLVDKDKLLENSKISGVVSKGPISPTSWALSEDLEYYTYNPEEAEELLESLGYTREGDYYITEDERILSFELKYLENDTNERLAETLEELLREEGVFLQLRPLSYEQFSRETLPTRNFELLLNEVEITVDPDQYNLWHSLRVDHPYLNISGYKYSRVDILLERARTTLNKRDRIEDYHLFQRYLVNDAPVIFLYHPKEYFIIKEGFEGMSLDGLLKPGDRYKNVHEWDWN